MLRTISCIAFVLSWLVAAPVFAHEFWVQPVEGHIVLGERMAADLRRGENFRGDPLVFNPANFTRFEIVGPSGAKPVEGRLGDRPALASVATETGLHVVVHVTDTKRTTYTALDQFAAFAALEGFDGAVAAHRARVTDAVFSEAYTRYAKALVVVGTAEVPDRTIGLPIEIVLEDAPFAGGAVTARVFLFGQPMVNALVRRFARPLDDDAAEAKIETARTDAWGRVTLNLPRGHRILLSAVHLREPDAALAKERNVVWETLWASNVFETRPASKP